MGLVTLYFVSAYGDGEPGQDSFLVEQGFYFWSMT